MKRNLSKIGVYTYGGAVVLLIILKVAGVIPFGWGWVLAPIWIPVAFILFIMVSLALIYGVDFDDVDDYNDTYY